MSFFVVDEADSMTDRPYDQMLRDIITPLKVTHIRYRK
jgi:superfamily II DNA/RNA helicase